MAAEAARSTTRTTDRSARNAIVVRQAAAGRKASVDSEGQSAAPSVERRPSEWRSIEATDRSTARAECRGEATRERTATVEENTGQGRAPLEAERRRSFVETEAGRGRPSAVEREVRGRKPSSVEAEAAAEGTRR